METSFVDLHVLKVEALKRKHGYSEKYLDKRSDYPEYTIICDTSKEPGKPIVEALCLDYIFVL